MSVYILFVTSIINSSCLSLFMNSWIRINYRYSYVDKTSDLWDLIYPDKTKHWQPKRSGFCIQNINLRYGLSKTRTFLVWFKFNLLPTYQRHMIYPSNPPPLLSIYKPRQYIDAEYNIFIFLLQLIIKLKVQEICGSPLAQAIHDGITLGNHKKYQ